MLGTREGAAGKDRDHIVNLSDGVFAIATTLSILDVRVPDIPESSVAAESPAALLALWPKYLGYLLSFVGISTFWVIHHSVFRSIAAYDRGLLFLNFVFLMIVAFVPFSPRSWASTATIGFPWPSTPGRSPWAGCS